MLLKTFQVKGFKCLCDTDPIRFWDDLTVFTGENDAGKSSLIKALELFLNPKAVPDKQHYYYQPVETGQEPIQVSEIILHARLQLSTHEQALWSAQFPFDTEKTLLKVCRTFTQEGGIAPYIFSVMAPTDQRMHNISRLTVAKLKEVAKDFKIDLEGATTKQPIYEKVQAWLANDPPLQTAVTKQVLPDEWVERLPSVEIFSSESGEHPEQTVHNMLKSQFRTLIRSGKFMGQLNTIETDINKELVAHADQYVEAIKKYVQDLSDVRIRPSFDFSGGLSSTQLELHRHGRQVTLQESGAGQRRRITLAIYEARLEQLIRQERESQEEDISDLPNLILAFDEPDTHLDYNWQRRIFDTITEFANLKAVQVLTCTHSLNFIERVPIQKIFHFFLDNTRITKCESFQFDPASSSTEHQLEDLFRYKISDQMGLRNSILLHERCFLVVEGETEMNALPVLFHLAYGISLQAAGICLLNGHNNSGVIEVIKFLHKHKRTTLFLIDSDSTPNKVTTQKLKNLGISDEQIHCAGINEFEDMFDNTLWAEVINELYPSSPSWTESDVEGCRNHETKAFSKRLDGIIYQRLKRNISKPNAGYVLANKLTCKSQIPDAMLRCFESAYAIANPK